MFLRIHMNLQGHILKVKATLFLANPDEAAAVKQVRLNQADKTKLTRDQLAADAIEDVNRQVDIDNMSFARKSMIRCGLALGIDGTWNVQQLFPHLQEIVAKYEQHFHSLEVPPPPMAP